LGIEKAVGSLGRELGVDVALDAEALVVCYRLRDLSLKLNASRWLV
jgi:hypothetical protein